ncbi:unnamed protein product [Choristocarpus tenellus]
MSMTEAEAIKDLEADEVEDLREAFRNFDKDGSGEIDEEELRTVMTSLGYNPTNKQLKDMMGKVDLDGNGLISFPEFVTMMRKCKVDTDFDRQIREAFKFFDKDGSGAIDQKELGDIMRQLGAKLSDAEIELLVQAADVDGDGQVDINEVCGRGLHGETIASVIPKIGVVVSSSGLARQQYVSLKESVIASLVTFVCVQE